MKKIETLSIIIPVYNEEKFVAKTINKVKKVRLGNIKKEIIVVDDGSTDGTKDALNKQRRRGVNYSLKIIHKKNGGKGSAIRYGLRHVSGDVVVIQDADLEYDPQDFERLTRPIVDGDADVVYGSRFVGERPHRVLYFWHMVANNFLTLISNMFTNLNLTDMETGYKMFTTKVAENLTLEENGFGMEPEFTAKIAKMSCRVFEVGISYHGRNYEQGKKINWKDGVWALWCIIRYNISS